MKPEELISRHFEKEFIFSATRSSGPGGQNVNKVNTRIELRFNIGSSILLSEVEKQTITAKLGKKITADGDIIIISQSARSQLENKRIAIGKFYILIAKALTKRKRRIPTSPGAGAIARRLEVKRKRSEIKKSRGGKDSLQRD
jgi:ribosome-associated protein